VAFRTDIPASLQAIVQNGLLDNVYEKPLLPVLLWERLAEIKPWGANLGAESIMTKAGLIPVTAAPVTGQDAPVASYGFEQYTMTMDQYGKSVDTNMMLSAMALASKFLEDNQILAVNAGQTLNQLARTALYGAYGTGTTWVATAAASGATTLVLANASGFTESVANASTTRTNPNEALTGTAVPTRVPVSGSTPYPITVGGTANTITGVDVATNTVTLGTALGAAAAVGTAVTGTTYAPVSFRPNGRASAAQLISTDVATLALFQSAVTRLRNMNVPTVGGAYTAHVSPQTVEELFATAAFQRVYTGKADSPAYTNLHVGDSAGDNVEFMGKFGGINWFLDTLTPTETNPSGETVYRPIVAGAGSLIKGPFERMADLVAQMNAGSTVQIDMIGGVARILRSPLDRFGQVLSSTWSWIGGFAVGTDLLTGDGALYKRAVVVEHV